eukprot:CAMPEP_0181460746 /NCGR_PEP_ID=MMETSP1110-20121109/33504_1 /TAXON_ID=174948 /ORGANISM="Symbiodinium sp., Strain CCMP421" /LENGTH=294 /DNA_ID=CAMNT_0023585315 /DNA_START=79 /DNA_END=963 /DNA_ORIENTATION=-
MPTPGGATLGQQALVAIKGVVGVAQTYILRNETACTVKVLVNEDPEALKTVAKAKGGLGWEFTLAGENPVGVGGQAAYAVAQGQRKPVDLTVQPNSETSTTASTSTVFVSAAFWADGAFKIVWESRSFGASSTIHFLQRHLDDKSEQWIRASSLQEALRLKQQKSLSWIPEPIPQEAFHIGQDASRGYSESPRRPSRGHSESPKKTNVFPQVVFPRPTAVPKEFFDVTRLAAWSQTCNAFVPARVLGVAPAPVIDPAGQPLAYLEIEYPDGCKRVKVVSPAAFATHLREQPPRT